jgi:hypothetical protein
VYPQVARRHFAALRALIFGVSTGQTLFIAQFVNHVNHPAQ